MKLFISLIAIFFLIAGCGGEGEEETGAGDEKVVGDGENPEANEADEAVDEATDPEVENLADSGSNSVSVTCVPYESGPNTYNIPSPIPGGRNLELTQLGEFDCPQEAPHNCSRCELLEDAYLGLAISLECTSSDDSVYFPVGNGTFIRQIGMSCTNNNL